MERDLDDRLLEYSARITKLVGALPRNLAGRTIGDQLVRCGMSVGANYEEAQAAESRVDFIHKLQLALKELRESHYWLRLIVKSEILPEQRLSALIDESNQLRAILSKAVATAKEKSKNA